MKTRRYPTYYPEEYYNGEHLIFPSKERDNLSYSDKIAEDWEYGGGEFSYQQDIRDGKHLQSLQGKRRKKFKNQSSTDLRDLYRYL